MSAPTDADRARAGAWIRAAAESTDIRHSRQPMGVDALAAEFAAVRAEADAAGYARGLEAAADAISAKSSELSRANDSRRYGLNIAWHLVSALAAQPQEGER